MRELLLNYLRTHPNTLSVFWKLLHFVFASTGWIVPVKPNKMLITSFAGRKYDDSPKALYEEICKRKEFSDWNIVWAFVNPLQFDIPKGKKIKIDTPEFFMALLNSRVWISNSGMDRNIGINKKKTIKIETWHGTPLKKIGKDQHSGVLGNYKPPKTIDKKTIRCAQSTYDRDILADVFSADKNSFLLCDLPRNDSLLNYTEEQKEEIRRELGVDSNKKILLYMPTYREYLINDKNQTYIAPPITLEKWERELGDEYVLLIRAHYAVSASMGIDNTVFHKNVSDYPYINDLYSIADILISDYSSAFFDYSILDKPMLCFAYDLEEYKKKRGLYFELKGNLPCNISQNEDDLIREIVNLDYNSSCEKTALFHKKFAPYAGYASKKIVDKLIQELQKE